MRNFLITKKAYNCGKLAGFEILGMVQRDCSPAFDKETAKMIKEGINSLFFNA